MCNIYIIYTPALSIESYSSTEMTAVIHLKSIQAHIKYVAAAHIIYVIDITNHSLSIYCHVR